MEAAIAFIVTILAKKGINKSIDKSIKFLSQESYRYRLRKIILNTIGDYDQQYPTPDKVINDKKKHAFFKSPIIFKKLFLLRFHNDSEEYMNMIKELEEDENLLPFTETELKNFFQIFDKNIETDPRLKPLFFDENHKEQIALIYQRVKIQNKKLDTIHEQISSMNYKEWLNKSEEDLYNFKPKTALEHLIKIEQILGQEDKMTSKTEARIILDLFDIDSQQIT